MSKMKTKHSPGPYKVAGGTNAKGQMFVWTDRGEDGKGMLGSHEVCVAIVTNKILMEGQDIDFGEEGVHANAHLFAASDDLLQASESTCRRLEDLPRYLQENGHPVIARMVYEELEKHRAAITKATKPFKIGE